MQVSSYLPRVLCVITYLFAIGITIWAVYKPYMNSIIFDANIDIYMDKECINNNCDASDMYMFANRIQGTALQILYIIFIVLAILCLVLSFTKHTKLCSIVGLLLLGMALVVMITLTIIIKTSRNKITINDTKYYNFTLASILVIVACCLMIVKQLIYNGMLHSVGRAMMRK